MVLGVGVHLVSVLIDASTTVTLVFALICTTTACTCPSTSVSGSVAAGIGMANGCWGGHWGGASAELHGEETLREGRGRAEALVDNECGGWGLVGTGQIALQELRGWNNVIELLILCQLEEENNFTGLEA